MFKTKAKVKACVRSITDEVENDLMHNKIEFVFRGNKQMVGSNAKSFGTIIHKIDGSPCKPETDIWFCHQILVIDVDTS